jgi:translation initiation factor 1
MSTRNARSPSDARSALVYSTEAGRMCLTCRQAKADCRCAALAAQASVPQGDGTARVGRSSKGRGGKTVTEVRGLALAPDALADLGKRLRTACGAGGTVKDGVLEVQGDNVERVMVWLQQQGHKVKRVGG